jgi:FMN phosphatase YigB (HAD superfamily)
MDKLRPKAVIFDLGSTLIEYEAVPWDELHPISLSAGRRFLIQMGKKVPDEEPFLAAFNRIRQDYRDRAERELVEWEIPQVAADLLAECDVDYDDRLVDRFFDAYYVPVGEKIFAFDDTISTLQKVKEQFPVVGLVSNTVFPERCHQQELQRFEIKPHLDFTVFSSTFGLRKPHPDIFYKAANLAGYAPSECVYIGDRYMEDVQGPNGIGMPAVLKVVPERDYPHDMPDTVRRIDALSDIFEQIENRVD